jgi:hypothetical protein
MEKFSLEEMSPSNITPEGIRNMYKVEGYENFSYDKYLSSKKLFESKTANFEKGEDGPSSIKKIENDILEQDKSSRAFSIENALQNSNIEIQRMGASLIEGVPEKQRENLKRIVHEKIVKSLNSQNIQVQRIALNMIRYAPESTVGELKELVLEKITNALSSGDINNQKIMAKKIGSAPEGEQENLREITYRKIIEGLNEENIFAQRVASTMVQYAPSDKHSELINLIRAKFELAKQQGRFNQIVESPLYAKNDEGVTSTFTRESFSKTGSGTTLLLGKEFKNNLIIRHIEKSCFLAWEKAYEGYADWSKAGFDYVPIEPIYSFNYDNQGKLINVTSGVLDLNLEEWYAFSGNTFKENLDEKKNTILNVLAKFGIDHGHPNDANFCLRFTRDKNGNADITKIPRVYLIDFDQAVKDEPL